jgi:DNA-binding transcriptional regulator YhcF (GntR family)
MSSGYSQTPRIMELAQQLEADIRRKQLKPGDPYLPLVEAARMLGVGTSTANRALQLLAQRGLLERVQRRGTFIGSLQREASPGQLKRVFMLVHRSYLRQEGLVADGVLVGIQGVLPGVDVQFNFLPATDPTDYVDSLIAEILRAKEPAGIVLTKVPFAVQRAVRDSGLPAVVHGSPFPSIEGMAWVSGRQCRVAGTWPAAGRVRTQGGRLFRVPSARRPAGHHGGGGPNRAPVSNRPLPVVPIRSQGGRGGGRD